MRPMPLKTTRARSRTFRVVLERLESRQLFAVQPLSMLSSLPGVTDIIHPASNPALPGSFDAFAPQLGGSAAANTPTIAEWTRTGGPDQSLVLTGDRFGAAADTHMLVFGETTLANAGLSDATVGDVDGAAASVTLPGELPADSMYLLWTKNTAGYGRPVAVNRAEAWWVGPDAASAGDFVSIYGRNLTLGSGVSKSAVYLEPAAGNTAAPRWVMVTDANPYKLTIALPADLAAGDWQVWTHNGHGAGFGWSAPVALSVRARQPWSSTVFNVRSFGAKGDGHSDDQNAIRAAITAASQTPGSTVYLPAGTYMVNGGFAYLHDVRLVGDGMTRTIIAAGPSFRVAGGADPNRQCLIFSPGRNVELSSLGLSANGNVLGSLPNLLYARGASDLRLSNVSLDSPGLSPADLHLTNRVSFSHCRIVGKEVFLGSATQLSFDSCSFFMTSDSVSALLTWGAQQLSLTRNTVQNLDPSDPNDGSGWGEGRFLNGNDNWGAGANIYVGDNTTVGLGVRSGHPNQNNGEQINWEGTVTIFDGAATGGSASTVNLAGYNGAPLGTGEVVTVVSGKGMGQTRVVTSASGSTIAVQTPWNVVPDATSRVYVSTLPHNITVYGNTFGGRPEIYQSTAHNASAGVEMFEGAVDVIVDSNTFRQVRTGVSMWGGANDVQPADHVNPLMFTYVANNRFDQVRVGIGWARRGSDAGVPFVGNVLTHNTATQSVLAAVTIATTGQWASLPQIPNVNIIEATFCDTTSPTELFVDDLTRDLDAVLMRQNSFDVG